MSNAEQPGAAENPVANEKNGNRWDDRGERPEPRFAAFSRRLVAGWRAVWMWVSRTTMAKAIMILRWRYNGLLNRCTLLTGLNF